jgi:hypothetical protein
MYRTFACTVFATLLLVTPQAQKDTTIRIWKVGSPHTGDTPHTDVPPLLAREVASRGWRLSIDAFPAQSFADWFFAAVRDGSAPDLLVFDNFGIMGGISTRLGTFVAIDQDPVIRNQLVQVTRRSVTHPFSSRFVRPRGSGNCSSPREIRSRIATS